jgi:hypothetical protein
MKRETELCVTLYIQHIYNKPDLKYGNSAPLLECAVKKDVLIRGILTPFFHILMPHLVRLVRLVRRKMWEKMTYNFKLSSNSNSLGVLEKAI